MSTTSDRELGMTRNISRRDFLQKTAAGAAATAMATPAAATEPVPYPPAATGLRGSHDGSFEDAHALAREGRTSWPAAAGSGDEELDLVVVGAGVSGLAAAYFYRQTNPQARILILDNHDDFGGHAKRNEFAVGGRQLIGYGGSQSIEGPSAYSDIAMGLLRELTVNVDDFYSAYDREFYQRNGLTAGVYFDAATYGRDQFVPAPFLLSSSFLQLADSPLDVEQALSAMPLGEQDRAELERLVLHGEDALPDIGITNLGEYLSSISYQRFLLDHVGLNSTLIDNLLRRTTTGYFGVGTDATPAAEAMLFGLPGLNKLGIPGATWMARQALEFLVEPYIFHYPDGNATIARLLARSLIPELCPAGTASELVQARFDYAQLDVPHHNTRIRLNSTVLNVGNTADGVDLTYIRGGRTFKVRAKKAVLACYNMMIPYLCPELPAAQKQALSQLVKVPLVYTNVALTNWRALKEQHVGFAYTPSSFHSYCMMDFPVSMGGYEFSSSADDPVLLHFSEALTAPGLPPRDQHRLGRARLLATPFEAIERDLRETLTGMLSPGGFDPAEDIAAITVNRWPHGYAYGYNPLFDPEYQPGTAPHEIGRQPAGNIAIANSDAGARAYLDEAINQARRAIEELSA